MQRGDKSLWNGTEGAGGISWVDRSRMGLLRGVIDAADANGRRNAYMHALHRIVLERELRRAAPVLCALDFGCGTGRFLKTLRRHCALVYGVDREPAMVDAARVHGHAYADCIEWCPDGEIPFADGIFDFVLCSSVLCVTATELFEWSLCEMARVASRGATLLLLEQVSSARDLTLRRYFHALAHAGFEPVRAFPIRAAGSRFTNLVGRLRLPEWSYGQLARIELFETARRADALNHNPYVEYAIISLRR